MAKSSREVADATYVLNYPYLVQNIGVIVGRDAVAVVDTRTTAAQAREILDDIRAITKLPVTVVIDTHGHSDHAFGNNLFRPAVIWGQKGCPAFMARTGEQGRAEAIVDLPDEADEIRTLKLDPPDQLVDDTKTIDVGGRQLELTYLGRGHTDHDLVIRLPEANIVFAGDLVTNTAAPYFGDSFPLEWPATVKAIGTLQWDLLITGHGPLGDRDFLKFHEARLQHVVDVARAARAAGRPWQDVVADIPMPADRASPGVERAYAQLDGTL